jgi:cyclopropane fatty-acyl-phospholipid synthase-like methyltransferase
MPSFVGFVPTHPQHVDAFFELAALSLSDIVYDLGSGDGRLVFAAIERGAGRAVGIELDRDIVRKARSEARKKHLQDRASFIRADVLDVDLSEATAVFCYLTPQASAALKTKLERELKPGARVVMESFPIPGWTPAQTAVRGYADYYETNEFYLYVIPPLTV